MPRLASLVLVLALLGGTAAAFAVTERLKLEEAPIYRTKVDKAFSPVCRCPKSLAHIAFALRRQNDVRLEVVRDGAVVRTLVRAKRFSSGLKRFTWNGRDDRGAVVPDGEYAPRVRVGKRTLTLPNAIRVDTEPPRIRQVGRAPFAVVPNKGVVLRVRYRVDEPAHGLLYLGRKRVVRTRFQRLADTVSYTWADVGQGPQASFFLAAEDTAGNVSRPVPVR